MVVALPLIVRQALISYEHPGHFYPKIPKNVVHSPDHFYPKFPKNVA